MISIYCQKLIEESQNYKPTYARGRLAIHLPMSLIALDTMNASELQLQSFYDKAILKLDKRKQSKDIVEINSVKDYLGQKNYFESYVVYFENRTSETSVEYVLKEVLPILITGISASAFHPAIRLSYALKIQNNQEIILSLASWATEFLSFNNILDENQDSMLTCLKKVNHLSTKFTFSPGNIVDRMQEINVLLNNSNLNFTPNNLSYEKLRTFCIEMYAKNNNFTILHTVTACFALKEINPFMNIDKESLKYIWEALLIGFLSTGIDYESSRENEINQLQSWETIKLKACDSKDDHVVKLVFTAWQEFLTDNNKKYHFVANRAVKNL